MSILGKTGEKNFTKGKNWKFGKINQILKGKKVCILSYGPVIKLAFEAQKMLKKEISIYSCHTLKPFNVLNLKKRLMVILPGRYCWD